MLLWRCLAVGLAVWVALSSAAARDPVRLDSGWSSIVFAPDAPVPDFSGETVDMRGWRTVDVPHNWQGYAYNRQLRVGARHGVAWYRRTVEIAALRPDETVALRFEGVNSYATIWVNGREVGRHAGGLTGFEVDISPAVRRGRNVIAVRVDNPAGITDLPWVSGDDQPENGFAEGSQPFGIFRPVLLERSSRVRVRPFGAYAWGRAGEIDARRAQLTARVEIENRSNQAREVEVEVALVDADGRAVTTLRYPVRLNAGALETIDRALPPIAGPRLWSPTDPYLHMLRTRVRDRGTVIDETRTPFGIRDVRIATTAAGERRLLLNGEPVFLRGVAEYEHLLGGSHAFADEQVRARVAQARAAGFNAWRDAHYPHNLRYGDAIAGAGLMWWPQFSAHIWFDNTAFRQNFRALLADWVRERRNNPAIFLWGLQNESRLPKAFAEEMVAVLRDLDPTASTVRLIVTCNGGEGTDWNVPQNWSGTYGGDPDKFGTELAAQGLVGEYGGWRSLELHDEAPHAAVPPTSEQHFAGLMQTKARLADTVADRAVGHFQWLLYTHENPGRPMRADGTQIWDGVRALDHIGPANNKGLFTQWGEPTDAFYMYRARNVAASVAPMVYIVSHSWPDRWRGAAARSGIEVYSNCDAVDLYNDDGRRVPLGRRTRDAAQRFRWDGVTIRYDRLRADCILRGRVAASDEIRLNNLPPVPGTVLVAATPSVGRDPALYRVNVGGDRVVDAEGRIWQADRAFVAGRAWGWESWAAAYPGLDPMLGSRRPMFDPVAGAIAPDLYASLRYGRDALSYRFAVPDGRYRIELHFAEPWYGRAGIDARGWRVFDVAVNGRTMIDDLDVFAEAGFARALVRSVEVVVRNGEIRIAFPQVKAGQAILSAVAILPIGATPRPVVEERLMSDMVAELSGAGVELDRFVDNGRIASSGRRWTLLPHALLDSDVVRPTQAGGRGALTPRVDVWLYRAMADDRVPSGWQRSDHRAALIADDGDLLPLRFVERRVAAGVRTDLSGDLPVLVRRALPSPYAPGNFSFAKDRSLFEAEGSGVTVTGAVVASTRRGHSGPGYLEVGSATATIVQAVETGAAAVRTVTLRYQGAAGVRRTAEVALIDSSGIAVARMPVVLDGNGDWSSAAISTPAAINAGTYRLTLRLNGGSAIALDSIRFE